MFFATELILTNQSGSQFFGKHTMRATLFIDPLKTFIQLKSSLNLTVLTTFLQTTHAFTTHKKIAQLSLKEASFTGSFGYFSIGFARE